MEDGRAVIATINDVIHVPVDLSARKAWHLEQIRHDKPKMVEYNRSVPLIPMPIAKHLHVLRIESLFIRDGGDLFDDKSLKEDLRVTIRIAVDFYHFLQRLPKVISPTQHEVMYINDTIRSGYESFYHVQMLSRILKGMPKKSFRWKRYVSLTALKDEYHRLFKKLQQNNLSLQDRICCLLELVKIEMSFLAITFY